MKLILAAVAALFFASCATKQQAPAPSSPAPTNDGGVYSDK